MVAKTARERSAKYRKVSREKYLEAARQYKRRHRTKVLAKGRERERRRPDEARIAVLTALGAVCVKCGFDDPRGLQIEHINDDGYLHRKTFNKDYVKMRRFIAEHIDSGDYQILCANCNWIKEIERRQRRCKQHPAWRPEAGL